MPICSTCILTNGFEDNCLLKQAGGNFLQISIIPSCYIDTITYDVDGVIDTITLDIINNPAAAWYTVVCRKDTVSTLEDIVVPQNFYNQTIAFTISNYANDPTNTVAAQLQTQFLSDLTNTANGFVVVVRDKVGVRRAYGVTNPLYVASLSKSSGLLSNDIAGTAITFVEAQPVPAPAIDILVTSVGLIPGTV